MRNVASVGEPSRRPGAAVAAQDALLAAGSAVAAVVLVSADGGSLSSAIAYLQDHLLVLVGG